MLRLAPVIVLSELTPHVTTYRKALFIMHSLFFFKQQQEQQTVFEPKIVRVSWAFGVFLVSIDTFGPCCGSVLVACAFCGLCILGRGARRSLCGKRWFHNVTVFISPPERGRDADILSRTQPLPP